jgi:uncharacterized protein (TIGR02757 family)
MKNGLQIHEIKEFLDEKADKFNTPEFIESDPISIPHRFTLKEDIEISGFLTATIAWGNRKSILQNAAKLMTSMGESPYDFVLNASGKQIERLHFVHRTFNSEDLRYFIVSLRNIYRQEGMQKLFEGHAEADSLQLSISKFKAVFFALPHTKRTEKHVSDPLSGSAAKRINMMLRWFVRKDKRGVDFGIWNGTLSAAQLSIPLDVHSGTVARELGLLLRKQDDAKAVRELDLMLRSFDAADPVKYDFALFGLGVTKWQ